MKPLTARPSMAAQTSSTTSSSGAAKSRSVENRPAFPSRHLRKLVPPLKTSAPPSNIPSADSRAAGPGQHPGAGSRAPLVSDLLGHRPDPAQLATAIVSWSCLTATQLTAANTAPDPVLGGNLGWSHHRPRRDSASLPRPSLWLPDLDLVFVLGRRPCAVPRDVERLGRVTRNLCV